MNQDSSGIKRFPQPTERVSEPGYVPISISHTQAILSYIVKTHGKPHNNPGYAVRRMPYDIEFRPIARVRPCPCDAKFSPGDEYGICILILGADKHGKTTISTT